MRQILSFLSVLVLSCAFLSFGMSSEPLLKTSWGQGVPYKNACPVNPHDPVDGQRTPPGCGAVAMAQIHNFYRTFDSAFGSNKYTSIYVVEKGDTIRTPVSINYTEHPFAFSDILDAYVKGEYSNTQANAVADYLYSIGTAMFMQYRPDGSSPINDGSMIWGLHHYLHFNPLSIFHYRQFFSTEDWIEMMKAELDEGHPIFYGGGYYKGLKRWGHFWVVDGIESDSIAHANFGKGSPVNNKWVDINVFDQKEGTGHFPGGNDVCYNDNQMMISSLTPNTEGIPYYDNGLILTRPIVLENDPELHSMTYRPNAKFTLGFRLGNYNRDVITQQYVIGIYQDDALVSLARANHKSEVYSCKLGAGNWLDRNKEFFIPTTIKEGKYQMRFVVKDANSEEWHPFFEAVKGEMELDVKSDGSFTITVPENHTLPTGLRLSKPITRIENTSADGNGLLLRVNFVNESSNNFCDTVKIVLKSPEQTIAYKQHVSVYDHSTPEWHILIPADAGVDPAENYEISAYYYEHNKSTYLPLTDAVSSVVTINSEELTGPCIIYSIDGRKLCTLPDTSGSISTEAIKSLGVTHGIYILKTPTRSKKIIL